MKIFTTTMIVAALATPLAAQWLHHPTPGIPRTADGKPNLAAAPPRTADGKPDLTGLWGAPIDSAVGNIGGPQRRRPQARRYSAVGASAGEGAQREFR